MVTASDIIDNGGEGSALPAEAEWLSSLIVSKYLKGEWEYDITQAPEGGNKARCEEETLASLAQFFKGLQAYHQHPYQRRETNVPLFWEEGSTRVLDYGREDTGGEKVPIVLFIPSLINRSYILDLNKKRSLLGYIKSQHIHAYLIDWGEPVISELGFSCEDYICRIASIVEAVYKHHHGQKITLIGYCMGGLMALASALQNLEKVNAVGLLATPWDFHKTRLASPALDSTAVVVVEDIIRKMDKVPKHLIQGFFYSQNPQMVYEKFSAFAELEASSREAKEFVAVERWVCDGISITSPVAKECLIDWGHYNATFQEKWKIAGESICLSDFPVPAFVAVAEHDHIVPPASSLPLASLIPSATLVRIPSGHVGMIIGKAGKNYLWNKFSNWLHCTIK